MDVDMGSWGGPMFRVLDGDAEDSHKGGGAGCCFDGVSVVRCGDFC